MIFLKRFRGTMTIERIFNDVTVTEPQQEYTVVMRMGRLTTSLCDFSLRVGTETTVESIGGVSNPPKSET